MRMPPNQGLNYAMGRPNSPCNVATAQAPEDIHPQDIFHNRGDVHRVAPGQAARKAPQLASPVSAIPVPFNGSSLSMEFGRVPIYES